MLWGCYRRREEAGGGGGRGSLKFEISLVSIKASRRKGRKKRREEEGKGRMKEF